MIDLVKETYNRFNGTGMYFALFYIALLYIYLADKKKREFLVYPSILFLLVSFTPVTAYIIGKYIIGDYVYWRIFWLLPMVIVIAYAGVHLISAQSNRKNVIVVSISIVIIIMLSGNFIVTKNNFQVPENYFKIPNEAIDISLMVQSNKEKNAENSDVKLATPYELACTIRQYDSRISLLYGRDPVYTYSKEKVQVSDQLNSLTPNMDIVTEIIRKFNCKYIVLRTDQQPNVTPEELGFIELGRTGIYILYKDTLSTYDVTQYGNKDGGQSMFYTIEDCYGRLIVIDGGYADDAPLVRQVIAEKGNKVDCWILTHPHPDHIGAFNSIYANPEGISIESIYTIDVDYEKYKSTAKSWDGIEFLDDFLNITKDANVRYLKQGDVIDIHGLELEIYSAYDDYVSELSGDLFNDGSLMFEIKGKSESMLFCSDVGIKLSDVIMNKYGDELKADYIQMGHHGNGGLSDEFYNLVNPKVAFFDAPDWLMNNINPTTGESSTWTTPEKKALMEGMGTEIYSFSTAPNKIKLK